MYKRQGLLSGEMVRSMADSPIVFAMANPTPEIFPEEAIAAGAAVVATGRSDFPNQVNNCLGFPGIFRGALDVRARCINEEMKLAASGALASLVSDCLLYTSFDDRRARGHRAGAQIVPIGESSGENDKVRLRGEFALLMPDHLH